MSSELRERRIHITYYRNPHCFYFKFHDELFDDDLLQLETEIAKQANGVRKANLGRVFRPFVGFIVAAYIIYYGKWVRAKVVKLPTESHPNQFVVWAVDHGVFLTVPGQYISTLTMDLIRREVKGVVAQGSLFGLMPAKTHLNSTSLQAECVQTVDWSAGAIELMRAMLTSVPYLYFQIHATVDNYYFGDLSYEAIDKRLVRINHDLEQHQLAIRVESSIFQKEMSVIVASYDGLNNTEANRLKKIRSQDNRRKQSPIVAYNAPQPKGQYCISDLIAKLKQVKVTKESEFEDKDDDERSIDGSICDSEIDGGRTLM